jgi:hypothetical protein
VKRKAEEDKEMERHKRWEARARKEEEDRQKRENMRSARIREKARLERGERYLVMIPLRKACSYRHFSVWILIFLVTRTVNSPPPME